MIKSTYKLGMILILFLVVSGAHHPRKIRPPCELNGTILSGFQELVDHISGHRVDIPAKGLGISLIKKLRNAKRAYLRCNPCTSARILRAYLHETQALRRGKLTAIAEDLYNRGYNLYGILLSSLPSTAGCPHMERAGRDSLLEISHSDNEALSATLRFGDLKLQSVKTGGELFTQIHIEGTTSIWGGPGKPAVPVLRRLVAVPMGAEASIKAVTEEGETIHMNLFPVQSQPVDGATADQDLFSDPPFQKDEQAYGSDAPYPQAACWISPLGTFRDLQVVEVSCAAGQYNPVTDALTLFDSVQFEVDFAGGSGYFVTDASLSPFEMASLQTGALINQEAIHAFVRPGAQDFVCSGEELLILTHPDFLEAAQQLSQWKREKGIITNVFQVADGEGPGPDTAEEIDAFIEQRYDECMVRPSYVLLVGDHDDIPTFSYQGNFASDYPYAVYGEDFWDALLPDFALGRIPVNTLQEALTVVGKIIQYEKFPPENAPFYQKASLAAQFQCCRQGAPQGTDQRTFIEASEFARALLQQDGYQVQRIYTVTDWDGAPRFYYDGSPLPDDLGPLSGFDWNGNTQMIIDAFNDGRFLIMHRDHGWRGGWIHPNFEVQDVDDHLVNGELLPVVLSINCASGMFDAPSPSLAEALLIKEGGGAVGVLGDTHNSPSWPNTYLTKGIFDALWPQAIPDFGEQTSHHRLGDILNHAKFYMLTQVGAYTEVVGEWGGVTDPWAYASADTIEELYLWHVLGDPTLEVWTAIPGSMPPDYSIDVEAGTVGYEVEGATITAYQEGDGGLVPIGRGVVEDGVAVLNIVDEPDPNLPLQLAASKDNRVAARLTSFQLVQDQVNDQDTSTSADCGNPPGGLGSLFQGFTPAASRLAAVYLRLRVGGGFPAGGMESTLRIRSGSPSGDILGETTAFVTAGTAGEVLSVRFLFSSPLTLIPGDLYIIEWISPEGGGTALSWMVAGGNPYVGGSAYGCTGMVWEGRDFLFSTYTDGSVGVFTAH